jgi:hypothetical protein
MASNNVAMLILGNRKSDLGGKVAVCAVEEEEAAVAEVVEAVGDAAELDLKNH